MHTLKPNKHPWQEAKDRFDERTLPYLKTKGRAIAKQAAANHPHAEEIIRLYAMLRRSFDPLTYIRLEEAIDSYETSLKSVN